MKAKFQLFIVMLIMGMGVAMMSSCIKEEIVEPHEIRLTLSITQDTTTNASNGDTPDDDGGGNTNVNGGGDTNANNGDGGDDGTFNEHDGSDEVCVTHIKNGVLIRIKNPMRLSTNLQQSDEITPEDQLLMILEGLPSEDIRRVESENPNALIVPVGYASTESNETFFVPEFPVRLHSAVGFDTLTFPGAFSTKLAKETEELMALSWGPNGFSITPVGTCENINLPSHSDCIVGFNGSVGRLKTHCIDRTLAAIDSEGNLLLLLKEASQEEAEKTICDFGGISPIITLLDGKVSQYVDGNGNVKDDYDNKRPTGLFFVISYN